MNDLQSLLKNYDDDLLFNPNIEAEAVTVMLRKMENDGTVNSDLVQYLKQWIRFHQFLNIYEEHHGKYN